MIATLANYFYSLGESVLIITPGKKANDEIVKRCKSMFSLEIPSSDLRINNMITQGLLNRNDTKIPESLEKFEKLLASYDNILVDEVEYTINESGEFLYSRLTGAKRMYGFSGTADKESGEMITFLDGLSPIVLRNKDLIKYFGPSLVYRMPIGIDISNTKVKTPALDTLAKSFKDGNIVFSDNENIYNSVQNTIWKDPDVCKAMVKVVEKYPRIYIPMNNLYSIIEEWIRTYFIGRFRVLLICYEGYIYYDLKGNRENLGSLQKAWEYVNKGLVDVIPSTSSGFRALDLPGIDSILLIIGKNAGTVLQSIGRAARGTHMNIVSFEPMSKKSKLPVYSKMLEERDEMIHTYYKYCRITDSVIYEENL